MDCRDLKQGVRNKITFDKLAKEWKLPIQTWGNPQIENSRSVSHLHQMQHNRQNHKTRRSHLPLSRLLRLRVSLRQKSSLLLLRLTHLLSSCR